MQYVEELIVEGIKANDTDTIEYIYKKFYPTIKNFIILNSGGEDDAKDIFQESIIIIFKKIRKNNLVLTCSFKTFLFSVCKNLWLKELEKRKNKQENVELNEKVLADQDCPVEIEVSEEYDEYKIYQKHFLELSDDCQKVLRLFLDKVSLKEIANIMGYSSEKYAKKRKYQCKETLVKRIQSDVNYKRLK